MAEDAHITGHRFVEAFVYDYDFREPVICHRAKVAAGLNVRNGSEAVISLPPDNRHLSSLPGTDIADVAQGWLADPHGPSIAVARTLRPFATKWMLTMSQKPTVASPRSIQLC